MKIKTALIALFVVALLGGLGHLWFAPVGLATCPDISLMTITGEELQLARLQGNPVLVTFWSTTCPGCIRELPHLIDLYQELSPRGLQIIGIAMAHDRPDRVLAMSKARNLPYPVALDIHADAARAFGNVNLTPTSFLIAPDGRIAFQKTGEMNFVKLRDDILGMLGNTSAD
jgi:peroxiredoxin